MKGFLIWLCVAMAIFLIALQAFRATLPNPLSAPEGERTGHNAPNSRSADSPSRPRPAKSGSKTARSASATPEPSPEQTLRVPSAVTDLFSLHAIDIDSGEFTPEIRELLDLHGKDLAATRAIFEDYFEAHAAAELATARFLTEDELAKERTQPNETRIAAIRIVPLGDRMAESLARMRNDLIDTLGRSRGFTAASLISHQLGNAGRRGELVSFVKYPKEENYRLEVTGRERSFLRAGSWTGRPIYTAPDFSQLARYRHLARLAVE